MWKLTETILCDSPLSGSYEKLIGVLSQSAVFTTVTFNRTLLTSEPFTGESIDKIGGESNLSSIPNGFAVAKLMNCVPTTADNRHIETKAAETEFLIEVTSLTV